MVSLQDEVIPFFIHNDYYLICTYSSDSFSSHCYKRDYGIVIYHF